MEHTVESLRTTANVFSEVVYQYFALLNKEGNGGMQIMVQVEGTDVIVQYDDEKDRIAVTVPRENFELPYDEIERAEFPVNALVQVVETYFKRMIMEDKGNGATVKVDDIRYNVWLDDTDQQIKYNIDAEDRKKLEDD
jgi:hypothetical protein